MTTTKKNLVPSMDDPKWSKPQVFPRTFGPITELVVFDGDREMFLQAESPQAVEKNQQNTNNNAHKKTE
ncbi:hypothetical protein GBK02_10270 [Dechloromonas sp. TW-R-39-2]|uniref:hypothetical protein n=1 Tax=Dechloromonas sp. TW-R-39-2 TaxID=2654218 RepID=UPI00193C9588|nr:hypothetical protein [Dechloromonas sp. TW-R-39-2]QRM19759.1 hypothetical protein GBK02_10270 [Dechloromonas sp. TW-R-39-2]